MKCPAGLAWGLAGGLLLLAGSVSAQGPCPAGQTWKTLEFWPQRGSGCASAQADGGVRLQGAWTFTDRDGAKVAQGTFRGGLVPDPLTPTFGGQSASLPLTGREGAWREWDARGPLRFEGAFRAGELDGQVKAWFAPGLPRLEATFRAGTMQGLWREWWESGHLQKQVAVRDGRYHGTLETWFEHGARELREPYVDGEAHGVSTRWHANGKKAEEGEYVRGHPAGTWTEWCADGRVKATTEHASSGSGERRVPGPCDAAADAGEPASSR